jgi:hypothetical protein
MARQSYKPARKPKGASLVDFLAMARKGNGTRARNVPRQGENADRQLLRRKRRPMAQASGRRWS